MVFSINYQNLYNFSKDWRFNINGVNDGITTAHTEYEFSQTGDLYALGLAYAIQATDSLSLGMTLNFWGDYIKPNEWKQKYAVNDITTLSYAGIVDTARLTQKRSDTYQFKGFNANLGLFWEFYQKEDEFQEGFSK